MDWRHDPNSLKTSKVQLWSSKGVMLGLVSLDEAKRMVRSGSCFVVCNQAITEEKNEKTKKSKSNKMGRRSFKSKALR